MNLLLVAFASLFCNLIPSALSHREPCCCQGSNNCQPSHEHPIHNDCNCINNNWNCVNSNCNCIDNNENFINNCNFINDNEDCINNNCNCVNNNCNCVNSNCNCRNYNENCKIPCGYTMYNCFGAYKYHSESKNWTDARKICEDEGAHLAIPNSKKENAFLRSMSTQAHIWIGIHDQFVEGQFVTVLDHTLGCTDFINWAPNEPNNCHNNQDCGTIWIDGKWDDWECHKHTAFICEFNLCAQCK